MYELCVDEMTSDKVRCRGILRAEFFYGIVKVPTSAYTCC